VVHATRFSRRFGSSPLEEKTPDPFSCTNRSVPELPEVEIVRRRLQPIMQGARFTRVMLRRDGLRRPFPPNFAGRLERRTVRALRRRGKFLLAELSSGETLVMHLGMSGSIRVEARPGANERGDDADRHDHVVFRMSSGASITFNDPRRFGVMDLVPPGQLARHPALGAMGPEPLGPGFDGAALARACAGKRTSLKAALLDQHVIAGLGNIYASEALHRAGLSPRRRASTLATASGNPKPGADRLAAAIKQVLQEAIERKAAASYRAPRFRVYDREGERCPTRRCKGTVRRFRQQGRSTFYCPDCQR
jgi:formamidopyrimidine-DNA glycosylase